MYIYCICICRPIEFSSLFPSHLFNTARYIKPVFRSMASSAALNPSLWSPSSSPITARLRRAAPFVLPGGCRRKSFVAASAAFANENREWVLFLLFFKKKKIIWFWVGWVDDGFCGGDAGLSLLGAEMRPGMRPGVLLSMGWPMVGSALSPRR